MAVAGNFSAVVEIVEHAELQRKLVFVGSYVGAVHGKRSITIADRKVAEDLIVGAIFFQHINDMPDGILAARKLDLAGIGAKQIVFFNLSRVGRKILVDIREPDALDGTSD